MKVHPLPLVLALLSAASGASAQNPAAADTPPPGSAVIVGQVVDPASGRGVPGAVVAISGIREPVVPAPAAQPRAQVLTTTDGRFLLRNVSGGTHFITASKPGYISGSYGARRPGTGGAPLDVTDGERITDIVVPLWRWGVISGTVVDEAGEPLAGIDLRVLRRTVLAGRSTFAPAGSATTDDRGMYRIAGLPPGDYLAAVVVPLSSVPATVADAMRQELESGDLTRRSLAMSVAEAGMPLPFPGSPTALQVGQSIQNLRGPTPPPAGDDPRLLVYPTTYYPAARTSSEATVFAIRSGEHRQSVDFQIRPVRAAPVSGTVLGPDGPGTHIGLRLDSGDDTGMEPAAATVSDAAGAFTFLAVPAGEYTLRAARIPSPITAGAPTTIIQSGGTTIATSVGGGSFTPPPLRPDPTLWAAMPLTVGQRPLAGVTLALHTGSRLRGRLEFDGTSERPDAALLQRLAILLEPAAGRMEFRSSPFARVEPDGSFATQGFPGGRYFLRLAAAPPGWYFREALHDGVDLSDTPIVLDGRDLNGIRIVFTDRPTEVSGTVGGAGTSGDPDATVLIFPADPDKWETQGMTPRRFRAVRVSKTGTYKTQGLPPGEYLITAVPAEMAADWQAPQSLGDLAARAARLDLGDGEHKTHNLRTSQARVP